MFAQAARAGAGGGGLLRQSANHMDQTKKQNPQIADLERTNIEGTGYFDRLAMTRSMVLVVERPATISARTTHPPLASTISRPLT